MVFIGLNAHFLKEPLLYFYSDLGIGKHHSGGRTAAAEPAPKRKKMKLSQEDSFTPLDTGLSLAEDEALVLHLINSRS